MEGGNFQSLQNPKKSQSWTSWHCAVCFRKKFGTLNFERKRTAQKIQFHESRYLTSPQNSPVAKTNGCIFQRCRFNKSRTWKSKYTSLFRLWPIFGKKTEDKTCKIVPLPVVETPTSSNQVTLFHRDGFFKATPNPPVFTAPKKEEIKVKEKNVIDTNNQAITEEHDKSFVPWRRLASWKNAQLHGGLTVKVEIKCRKTVLIWDNLND